MFVILAYDRFLVQEEFIGELVNVFGINRSEFVVTVDDIILANTIFMENGGPKLCHIICLNINFNGLLFRPVINFMPELIIPIMEEKI